MREKLNLLLAGQTSATKVEFLKNNLETSWNIEVWEPNEGRSKLNELLPRADAVVGGNIIGDWPLVERLQLYQIPFAGYNWITPADIPVGVTFCNTYEHEIPIAEYVLLSILDWEINYSGKTASFQAKGWDGIGNGEGPTHGEVYGKKLGIIGYGRIGKECAKRASAFGIDTIGVTRSTQPTTKPLSWLGTIQDLHYMLAESDYILVACPQTEDTFGLIGEPEFKVMKPKAVIINVARGPIIQEHALYCALAEREIGGAIIDVWYDYPSKDNAIDWPAQHAFQNLSNVRMTPHVSGWSEKLLERRWNFVVQNLNRFARSEKLENIVFEGTGS